MIIIPFFFFSSCFLTLEKFLESFRFTKIVSVLNADLSRKVALSFTCRSVPRSTGVS